MDEFPKKTNEDVAHSLVKSVIKLVPGAGGPVAELLALVFGPPIEKRKEEWFKNLAQVVDDISKRKSIDVETLRDNPVFMDTVLTATTIAIKTSDKLKLEYLRNAVGNSISIEKVDETKIQVFLNTLDNLTSWHVRILCFFNDPAGWYKAHDRPMPHIIGAGLKLILYQAYPDLSVLNELVDIMWEDLERLGFHRTKSLSVMTTGTDNYNSRTTPLGKEFLDFILNHNS